MTVQLLRNVRHVILDRDGVINRELAEGWVVDYSQWEWGAGSLQALRDFTRAGIRLSVVTNQSCVGRQVATLAAIDEVHRRMRAEAQASGAAISAVFVCPHSPDAGCDCRKPKPKLVLDAIRDAAIAPAETLLIGDDVRDIRAGEAAGIRTLLVRSGKGRSSEARLDARALTICDDLIAAATAIIAANRGGG